MRILMLHNRYKIQGGEDRSTRAECELLSEAGHDVELLEVDNEAIPARGSIAVGLKSIWSRDSYRRIDAKLATKKTDVLHVQNFFPRWSPSVYYAAARHRTAVVQSVRNYRLICPASSLFRNRAYCDRCVGKKIAWPGVVHACYRESRPATAAVAGMIASHWALGTWNRRVDRYIALTTYVRDKLVQGGFPPDKIVVKPNFIKDLKLNRKPALAGNYFVFIGRLTREKGIDLLFQAFSMKRTTAQLKVVGGGEVPVGLTVPDGIEIVGQKSPDETYEILAGARALILPAMWAEPFGRVIIEAFALGIPVIATAVGALTELISHEINGLLVDSGQPKDLADAMDRLSDDVLCDALRAGGRRAYVSSFSPEVNYTRLMEIYSDAIESSSHARSSTGVSGN